ncbi:hypothetical protein ARMSODRAFT_1016918 [Armillaria solidipes]|uniref:Uncharacterized protein n=1 Tax=Armillaria solidipes TaxID=1076256 RepID=A0A2H3BSL4_9AGAR|nr:hypothetical protein ARMSODRAFT_1016918 [Armillaria solidipes]
MRLWGRLLSELSSENSDLPLSSNSASPHLSVLTAKMPVSFILEDNVVISLCTMIPPLLCTLDCNHAAAGSLHALWLALTEKRVRIEGGIFSTAVNTDRSTRLEHVLFQTTGAGVSDLNPVEFGRKRQQEEIEVDAEPDCATTRKRPRCNNAEEHASSPAATTLDDDDATVVACSSPRIDSPQLTPLKPSRREMSSGTCVHTTTTIVSERTTILAATAVDENDNATSLGHDISSASRVGDCNGGQCKSMHLETRTLRDPDYDPDEPDNAASFVGCGKGKCDKRNGNKRRPPSSYRSKAGTGKNTIRRGKPKDGRPNWTDAATLPPPNTAALQLLTKLSTVSSDSTLIAALDDLVQNLISTPCVTLNWEDRSLVGIAARCRSLQKVDGFNNYKMMCSYFQLVLTCDGYRKAAIAVGGHGPSIADFAQMAKTEKTTFQSWYSEGICLLYLAAAGTPYIFFLLAAAGMHYDVCHPKYSSMEDISGLAVSLRHPESGIPSYGLVTRLIIPHVQTVMDALKALDIPWSKVSLWNTAEKEWQEHPFSNHKLIQGVLDDVHVNFFRLPECIELWSLLREQRPFSCNAPAGPHYQIVPVYTIHTKFKVPKDHCPFNTDEAPAWTAEQRAKASQAKPVTSLQHLEAELEHYYTDEGEKWDPDGYLSIDTRICEGQTVVIRDVDAEPVAIIIPNMLSNLPHLRDSVVAC